MFRIQGEIQGVSPILFNKPPDDMEKPSAGKKSLQDKLAEVETRLHRNSAGEIVVPKWMFKQALLGGCTKAGIKVGRASAKPFFEATIFVDEDCSFGLKEAGFTHEHWGRIPPKTGAAVTIRRPAFESGWRLPFSLTVVDDRRDADQVRRAIEEAGMLVGLGAWRPEYGRFILTEWKVIPNA